MSGAQSPTARSRAELEARGYLVGLVEQRVPHTNITRDLFGMFDLVAIRDGETCGVQVTSASNRASRVRKITESALLPQVREAGWRVLVHSWGKRKAGWTLAEDDLS